MGDLKGFVRALETVGRFGESRDVGEAAEMLLCVEVRGRLEYFLETEFKLEAEMALA